MFLSGQSRGVVIGLAAVIVIAGYFVVTRATPQRTAVRAADWVCEDCGHMFIARQETGVRRCPVCPGEAVRTYIYYDAAKDDLIELYREKPVEGADPRMTATERQVKIPVSPQ